MNDTNNADADLAKKLSEQADSIGQLTTKSSTPKSIPSVYVLRDRSLQQRETRARRTTYLASGALILTVLGWGWQGLKSVDTEFPELDLRTVATGSADQTQANDQRVYTRWLEPVPVEWVDEEGHSLGFAGYVAEERTSWIDPRNMSPQPNPESDFTSLNEGQDLTIDGSLLEPAF